MKTLGGLFVNSSGIEELLIGLGIDESVRQVTGTIMAVALILFAGFLMTRLTKLLRLPNVTAYIVVGVLIGPSVLNLIPKTVIEHSSFLTDIALAFIAFGAGEFLKASELKKGGVKLIVVTLLESLGASVLVFCLCFFILKIDISLSLVLAALASATAPASTLMTIRQTNSKGPYVNALLEVIALDNVVSLLLYSVAISICIGINSGSVDFGTLVFPILKNLGCMIVGGLLGFLLKFLLPTNRTTDNRLIIVIALLFAFCGLCALLDQSPLLGCMAMGCVYVNASQDCKLFKQLNYFNPPIMLLFFVRSGMSFDLSVFGASVAGLSVPTIAVVVSYFVVRIAGKYGGAYAGSAITKQDPKIKKYLGFALVPAAGVAIGLAALGARTLGQFEQTAHLGTLLNAIILSSSILYEIVGPASAKLGLKLSGSFSTNLEEALESTEPQQHENDVEKLISQLQEIQKTIPEPKPLEAEYEEAFDEGAEEYASSHHGGFYRGLRKRK